MEAMGKGCRGRFQVGLGLMAESKNRYIPSTAKIALGSGWAWKRSDCLMILLLITNILFLHITHVPETNILGLSYPIPLGRIQVPGTNRWVNRRPPD